MVIIRRLKDTFQCTPSYDEQRITGRRVWFTKKLLCLPSNRDMNFNEIPLPPLLLPSLITKKQKTDNNEHDLQQSKLKNMVIDELKSFFVNQNHRQQYDDIQFQPPISILQTIQRTVDPKQIIKTKKQLTEVIISKSIDNSERLLLSLSPTFVTASTTLLASISFLTNFLLSSGLIHSSNKFSNVLNLFNNALFYSTSLTFICFGVQYIKRRKLSYIHRFDNVFTRNLLLQTYLTLLVGNKRFSQRQDIVLRLITSILHLIAGFTIHFNDTNTL